MRLYCMLVLLSVSLAVFACCGEDSENAVAVIEDGDIYGTIRDKETGDPIEGVSVDIGGKVTLTDENGKYILKGIPPSGRIDIVVTAANYREYEDTISLDQNLLLLDISLMSLKSPSAQILEVLDAVSGDIESLDPGRIPSIRSHFSRDYVAADNPVTFVGVLAGVIPSDYDGLSDAILTIIEKYDKLEFKFADPNVEFSGDSASAWMRFVVYAETKPPDPEKWDIIVNGRLDLRKQNGDWKITYWRLASDFLKFEWERL
jgi:hypothetical protein